MGPRGYEWEVSFLKDITCTAVRPLLSMLNAEQNFQKILISDP
jgi:hypothetical protein